ncbi:hypothetical protein MNBD_GAMMA22-1677 [hydrothermal vent metagenome]|uniref:SPOR domain-containing protein n=1 Tax=hydrothermal vent metagenome TaxID=652676 RepID=A0A3B0ZMW2_9ZZZZ
MKHFSNQPLEQLEPNYLTQYGLRVAPFAQNIEDQFIFLDADRVQHLNMLHHLTQYSDLLLIVTGDTGIGKTSLLSRFEKMADDDWQICNIEANALMASDQLVRQIFSGFGFESQHSASGDIQQLFLEELSELKHSGAIPILVIDDAHELPLDTLETLFKLADTELHDQRLLRIILFSDPSIEVTLKSSKINHLRERVTHSMELAPFTEEQTEQYIYHRLTVAGLKGNNPIDQKILRRIYRGSDGYPNLINKLTHIALQDGVDDANNDALFSESNYQFPTRKYLIFGSIAAIVIGVVLTIQSTINDLFDDSEQIVLNLPIENQIVNTDKKLTPEIILEKEIISEQPKPETISSIKPDATRVPKKTIQVTKKSESSTPEITKNLTNTTATPKNNLEERIILLDQELKSSAENKKDNSIDEMDTTIVSSKPESKPTVKDKLVIRKPVIIAPTLSTINPQKIYTSKKPQKITLIGTGFSERSYVTVDWSGNSKRLSSQQVKIINDKLIEVSLTTGIKPEDWSVTITHPKNGKSNSKSFKVTQTVLQKHSSQLTKINNEKWILAQDKKLFTLQLLGAKNKADITNFANRKKLTGQYAMFNSIRNGEVWYHLIYGSYKNKLNALNSIKAIPKKIGIGKPWIRPMLDVQNAVNRYQENKSVTKITASKTINPIQSAASVPKSIKEQSSWLWGQSPTHYTLQLLGTRTESSIKKFVLLHKLQGKAIYFNVKRQGKDWYSLVYGVYPDKNSAIKARTTLSKRLQKAKPWPRNFASIHAELDKNP